VRLRNVTDDLRSPLHTGGGPGLRSAVRGAMRAADLPVRAADLLPHGHAARAGNDLHAVDLL
jgi:hypothetical protein